MGRIWLEISTSNTKAITLCNAVQSAFMTNTRVAHTDPLIIERVAALCVRRVLVSVANSILNKMLDIN